MTRSGKTDMTKVVVDFEKFDSVSNENYIKAYIAKHYKFNKYGRTNAATMYRQYMYDMLEHDNEPMPNHAFYKAVLACGVPRWNVREGLCFIGISRK